MYKPEKKIKPQLQNALARTFGKSSDFDLSFNFGCRSEKKLRAAAVLVPIKLKKEKPEVIFTKRAASLKYHAGQVSFPGGKVEETDIDVVSAALRETEEEISLSASHVEILGCLSPHETVTGFIITPVIGLVSSVAKLKKATNEVDEIFSVPFSFLMNLENYGVHHRKYKGKNRTYYSIPYGPYYIWGATARIIRGLAEKL